MTTQVVNHLKSAVNGRSFEDIIIGPLDQDEFATVITMIRDIEMSAFFQVRTSPCSAAVERKSYQY